ncbi:MULTISPECIES: MarR family transcriptional regulator [Corynebacterium]|uniref:MarR family transcriptional regulator n=1 Tax=Corynebacterium TaxID=1716 RepID=UPI0026498992|nr:MULTISPECIES: MarR family transcriptional regulator [Corynebacterium]MDN5707580.1 MarR family transcriptional regulator [Corynebacterium casei]MDN5741177.1 MarR family transcriptional regulator [Corynebacterium casei]MDN5784500.1 MarR family transcriptional regulator [Corynebacterium casei]MDN5798767.1 MarR family transcriptional regulator [Corynebacterium casei]MDN5826383.1 MarR family transcriptional regulator [Corynebacterium casei]
MLAVHARYRGRATRRAELVERSAAALSTLDGVGEFEFLGVEDICADVDTATAVCEVVMALLADGSWAISIGVSGSDAKKTATEGLKLAARPGQVYATVEPTVAAGTGSKDAKEKAKKDSANIVSAFALLSFVLGKRTAEGREATSLVRSGLNQNEAAEELGISKQAMSQRLQAAGWAAEGAGWQLAVNLIAAADLDA